MSCCLIGERKRHFSVLKSKHGEEAQIYAMLLN